MEVEAKFPPKLSFLFQPKRYKIAYGGRGSGKSWGFARALLIQAVQKPMRVLCTREVQKSIKDSVHRLLSDQIADLGMAPFFSVMETEIRGINGSSFVFAGLQNHTVTSIKSFEGVDVVWIEEAQTVSKKSWDVLIPTIRKPGSEIWVSFNPELDTDETYLRFVANPPPESHVCEINYHDNPWFPEVLEAERKHCKLTNAEDYSQIWEGKCRTSVVGAIYGNEIQSVVRDARVCNLPHDPKLKVHTVWDLGWNDSMAIIFAQRVRSEMRVIDYIEDSHKTLDWYVAEIGKRQYSWGYDWIPHDGAAKDFKTGRSTEELLKALGRKPKFVPNVGVESGIKMARLLFPQTVFAKTKTDRLFECLKRYRRSINQATNEPGAPMHDEYSHGADVFRYLAVVAEKLTNEAESKPIIQQWTALDQEIGY